MGKRGKDYDTTPFDENASPQQKADDFDEQIVQHGGDPRPEPQTEGNWNPYGSVEERRK